MVAAVVVVVVVVCIAGRWIMTTDRKAGRGRGPLE